QFPDTDARYKDCDSAALLAAALQLVAEAGYRVVCVDLIVHLEKPKLSGYKAAMRSNIACVLGVEPARVNIKAKTNEGLDAVGRGEAVACTAVAALTVVRPQGAA